MTVTLNDKPFLSWTGPQSAIRQTVAWGLADPTLPGIGAYRSKAIFHSARLKMLTGKATPKRPEE